MLLYFRFKNVADDSQTNNSFLPLSLEPKCEALLAVCRSMVRTAVQVIIEHAILIQGRESGKICRNQGSLGGGGGGVVCKL